MPKKQPANGSNKRADARLKKTADPNVPIIQEALEDVMDSLRIPRGRSYSLRRGKGRVIVEPV